MCMRIISNSDFWAGYFQWLRTAIIDGIEYDVIQNLRTGEVVLLKA
jgi:hypothetical protein